MVQEKDIIFVSGASSRAFFQSVGIYAELMNYAGVDSELLLFPANSEFFTIPSSVADLKTKAIVVYRSLISEELRQACKNKGIFLGYTSDDYTFYEEDISSWKGYHPQLRARVRNTIKKAEFCFTGSRFLADRLKDYNSNSVCIGAPINWPKLFSKYRVKEPTLKGDVVRIVVTSGSAHKSKTIELLQFLDKNLSDVEIVAFGDYNLCSEKNCLNFQPYIKGTYFDWRNRLHELNPDIIIAEYETTPMIKAKSNVKFREAAYMRAPLIIIDENLVICKEDIVNGKTGYLFEKRLDCLTALRDLVDSKELRNKIGENMYNHHLRISPEDYGKQIWIKLQEVMK